MRRTSWSVISLVSSREPSKAYEGQSGLLRGRRDDGIGFGVGLGGNIRIEEFVQHSPDVVQRHLAGQLQITEQGLRDRHGGWVDVAIIGLG